MQERLLHLSAHRIFGPDMNKNQADGIACMFWGVFAAALYVANEIKDQDILAAICLVVSWIAIFIGARKLINNPKEN